MKTALVGLFSKMDTLFTILHERDYSGGVKYCEVNCLVVDLYWGSFFHCMIRAMIIKYLEEIYLKPQLFTYVHNWPFQPFSQDY